MRPGGIKEGDQRSNMGDERQKDERGDSIRREKQRCEKEKVAENCNEREGKGEKTMKADLTGNSPSG